MYRGAFRPKRAFQDSTIAALFSTWPACALMRLTMAVIGSPGARRGTKKMIVAPIQIVSTNMPSRRST